MTEGEAATGGGWVRKFPNLLDVGKIPLGMNEKVIVGPLNKPIEMLHTFTTLYYSSIKVNKGFLFIVLYFLYCCALLVDKILKEIFTEPLESIKGEPKRF